MRIRGILCDLDGVVYRAHEPCPGAVDGITAARDRGVPVLFMTNNASRTPGEVASQLTGLGLPTAPEEVLTASQVAAALVAAEYPAVAAGGGGAVLAVGGPGVGAALAEHGLRWVDAPAVRAALTSSPVQIDVVVQGYGPDVAVTELTEAAYAVAAGAAWVATNDDPTLPTERGLAPGNGSLLAAVRHATGAEPRVVGKPHGHAYQEGLRRLGVAAAECLMIGDRLDTDIAGARALGLPSALVLTGVSTREDALSAPESMRPDLVVDSLTELAHLWVSA
ncbi:HAD-IIA family hydrolase [Ornithinimicrobium sufpigmenti]|uniref:HAD-IIA family hydrolase n=1 Tax=Ornithinimicrobium sufpigmenti TaxID=2508882 RepID=UPI00235629DD|nr:MULTISPECIES: HAD-IIA family hydrolase [unclassified Ornithinimicrobium]